MFEELGISGGTALIILFAFYFIIKWGVKNGIKEAHRYIRCVEDLKYKNEIEIKKEINEEKK